MTGKKFDLCYQEDTSFASMREGLMNMGFHLLSIFQEYVRVILDRLRKGFQSKWGGNFEKIAVLKPIMEFLASLGCLRMGTIDIQKIEAIWDLVNVFFPDKVK